MTGFRFQHDGEQRPRAGAAVIVCLVLLALLAVAQVAHVHSFDTDADHCPLCIVMHSAAPVAVAAITIILVRVGIPAPVMAVRAAAPSFWHASLFIRPPPIG